MKNIEGWTRKEFSFAITEGEVSENGRCCSRNKLKLRYKIPNQCTDMHRVISGY